jgi:hypothetical protein
MTSGGSEQLDLARFQRSVPMTNVAANEITREGRAGAKDTGEQLAAVQGALPAERVPLVIGVTGHRDAICGPGDELQKAIRGVFHDIQAKCPHTPLIVLSALAEGADRLVAKIALDEFGAALIAPLPLPVELYEQDFPETCEEFRLLRDRAAESFEVPFVTGNTADNVHEQARRDLQYEAVGKYIARHSLLLVALWNGDKTWKVGGTRAVVQFQLDGDGDAHPSAGPLDAPKRGPVYQIVTPRAKAPTVDGEPYSWNILYPTNSRPADPANPPAHADADESGPVYDAILRRIGGLNHDISAMSSHFGANDTPPSKPAAPSLSVTAEEAVLLPPSSHALLDQHNTVDALAVHYANKTRSSFRDLFLVAMSAIWFFEVWAHLLWPSVHERNVKSLEVSAIVLLFAYPIIWLLALGAWKRTYNRDWHGKFQDYRALAEALRVQFFWHAIGLPDAVEDSYLQKQRGELEWIRCALGTWRWQRGKKCEAAKRPELRPANLPLIRHAWLEGQRDWFRRAMKRERTRANRYRMAGRIVFWTSVGCALLLAVALASQAAGIAVDARSLVEPMLAIIGTLTVLAATAIAWGEKMAFAEHANQYRTMANLFSQAVERFNAATATEEGCRRFIRELGREALTENGDWLLMHRERHLELPIP